MTYPVLMPVRRFCLFALLPLVTSCSTLGYYFESIDGHLTLISNRQPVAELLRDEELPLSLREQLAISQTARDFASAQLLLPDNGSYRSYADIGRPYAVWNVVAAPEFSVQPNQWCFAIVGCLSYRGYFSQERAQAYADTLRRKGYNVYVAGARAYSTLGWFDDPLLNTMLNQSEGRLVGLIFHELAHQKLYVKGDSAFNEAFATAVEREGVRRWFEAKGDPAAYTAYLEDQGRSRAFVGLLRATRARLDTIYALPLPAEEKRRRKQAAFDELREAYAAFKEEWGGYRGYDAWMAQDLNNAHLALIATYHDRVPAFLALLEAKGGDLNAFYAAAQRIGALPAGQRQAQLAALTENALVTAESP